MVIDASLLEVLACPACHAAFVPPATDADVLVCSGCARRYPVVDGIPVLLVDESTGPDDTAPDDTGPDDTAPDDTGPDDTAPDDTGSGSSKAGE